MYMIFYKQLIYKVESSQNNMQLETEEIKKLINNNYIKKNCTKYFPQQIRKFHYLKNYQKQT